ncbi:MAG: HAD-IA family hydrolase, partial [Anaeroplasmataceae bacterium]|nr:HAD-IA family hydrolase [Anaeroplasmataceae bacterium]
IYSIIEQRHGNSIASYYKDLEQNLELANCQANPEIISLFLKAKALNKTVIIISDMYFSKDFLKQLLNKCGIEGYDELFVSSELKKSKHTGEIFQAIKKLYPHQKILHIGDSLRGDYIKPKLKGIKAVHYKKYEFKKSSLEKQTIEKIFYNQRNSNAYYNLGFTTLGPALFGFVQWLHQELVKNEYQRIVFLSREGKLIKEVFDRMFDDIQTQYFYVSRRSTRCIYLSEVKTSQDIINIYPLKKSMTKEKYFSELGLTIEDKELITKEDILNIDEKTLKEIQRINLLNKQKLLAYLKQENVVNKTALCDIGWNGTMQDCLQSLEIADIHGYYYALSSESKNKTGYIDYRYVRPFVHLIENMFIANHGTTLGYQECEEGIRPILDCYELEQGVYGKIQEGAIDFINSMKEIFDFKLTLSSRLANENILRLGLCPTKADINLFKKTSYLEGEKFSLFTTKSLFYYIFHLKKFKRDFYNSGWKIAFLKSVFLMRLPYYRLYKIRKKK